MATFFGFQTYLWSLAGNHPKTVYYANGGIGDELMLTAVARAARLAGRPFNIVTALPEIWRGNPDPLGLYSNIERWNYAQHRRWISTEVVHLARRNGSHRHLAAQMAEWVGVTLAPDWRPVFGRPSPEKNPRRIVVQNSCRGARFSSTTKEWPQERWQQLSPQLARHYELVQLGTERDPPVPHAKDLRGRTTMAEAAGWLASAALFLGLESGLMHLAAATRTPAVIIYGGRTRPVETGYAFNRNLTREPSCAGCGLNDGCPHQLICLDIPVSEVAAAVHDLLGLPAVPPNQAA